MKKSLRLELSQERLAQLDHISEVSGKTRTAVVDGMIEHWAAVMADHERRGFQVVPIPGASFSAAMRAEREGVFDELAED